LFILKAIPLQDLTGPEGSRRLRLPDFKKIGTCLFILLTFILPIYLFILFILPVYKKGGRLF
jgi:hypothetical protein